MANFFAQLGGLLASASKIVFVMLAAVGCVGFLQGKLAEKEFMYMVIGAFSFYFGKTMPGQSDASPANPPDVKRTSTVTETVTPAPPIQATISPVVVEDKIG